MDAPPLRAFRQEAVRCFTRAADALCETVDALLTKDRARSLVELSQAPGFRRRWPSLYAALRDGRIDRDALRRLFVGGLPRPAPGARLVLGLDTSPIHRPEAPTLADRTLVYSPNLPAGTTPVRPGWAFSTLAVLPSPASSWTYLLDNERVPSSGTATTVGAQQLAAVLPLLPERPLLVGDGHYGSAAWVEATAGLPCDQVLRAKRDRVLYRPAPPRTGKRGRPGRTARASRAATRPPTAPPTRHGRGPTRWGRPSPSPPGRTSTSRRAAPWRSRCCGSPGRGPPARRATRASRGSGGWAGRCRPWRRCPAWTARRFGLEHGDRFDKQALLWEAPRLRTPAQFQTGVPSGPPTWWRSRTTNWSWPALGRASSIGPGRPPPVRSPRRRCGGRWGALWPRSGRRPVRRDRAGNCRGGREGPPSGRPPATRSSARGGSGRHAGPLSRRRSGDHARLSFPRVDQVARALFALSAVVQTSTLDNA